MKALRKVIKGKFYEIRIELGGVPCSVYINILTGYVLFVFAAGHFGRKAGMATAHTDASIAEALFLAGVPVHDDFCFLNTLPLGRPTASDYDQAGKQKTDRYRRVEKEKGLIAAKKKKAKEAKEAKKEAAAAVAAAVAAGDTKKKKKPPAVEATTPAAEDKKKKAAPVKSDDDGNNDEDDDGNGDNVFAVNEDNNDVL